VAGEPSTDGKPLPESVAPTKDNEDKTTPPWNCRRPNLAKRLRSLKRKKAEKPDPAKLPIPGVDPKKLPPPHHLRRRRKKIRRRLEVQSPNFSFQISEEQPEDCTLNF